MTSLIIIGIYLAILLVLGLASNRLFRGTSVDYMLASHSIGPFLLLMSLFGTTMTGFSMVGSSSASYRVGIGIYGLMASSSAILHPLCFFLIGLRLWSLGHRYGYSTQIEFFKDRLESPRIGWALFPVVVGLVIPYVLVGILSAGAVFNGASLDLFETAFADYGNGIPPWLGSLVVCLVVLTYVFFGGMRGTAWANAFQTCVFMALGVITFFVLVNGIGGQESFIDSLKSASSAVDPLKLSREKMPHRDYFAFLLIPFSIGMFPHIFQHWLTARDANAFKLPIVAHPLFVMIVWAPCVLIGTWASADGILPEGVNPNALLSYLVATHSGKVLAGLLTAGILAAIMSSLDSQFLCLGTMFTKDILRRKVGSEEDDRKTVFLARSFVVAVVAVCYLLSLVVPGGVFNLGVWCFAGFSALFPLVAAALYWRRLTSAGVYAGILTTAVLWCFEFWKSGYGVDKHYEFLGIHPVVSLVAGSTIAMIAVSLVTRPPSDETLQKFFPEK
ncbi:MAG: sodium:solute symporter family protein [Planctomycetota bacterium]|nr:sodium:solute symporter family protein [Planctomycetota bacterium]